MNIQATIQAVINTLGKIEVKGRENLDYLLGAILTLEQIQKALTAPKEEPEITIEPAQPTE